MPMPLNLHLNSFFALISLWGYNYSMKYVYCSGPLFCPEEIAGMTAIATVLEQAGFGTFVPHRDGLERFVMGLVNTPLNNNIFKARDAVNAAIFALDCFQIIRRCEYFVLNMNGRVPDEGAVAEAGIAFAVGKPIVLYKNDRRSVFKGLDNSMITGLSNIKPVHDINNLPGALLKAERAMNIPGHATRPALPDNVLRIALTGEKIWRFLQKLPKRTGPKKEIEDLIKNIVDICEQAES